MPQVLPYIIHIHIPFVAASGVPRGEEQQAGRPPAAAAARRRSCGGGAAGDRALPNRARPLQRNTFMTGESRAQKRGQEAGGGALDAAPCFHVPDMSAASIWWRTMSMKCSQPPGVRPAKMAPGAVQRASTSGGYCSRGGPAGAASELVDQLPLKLPTDTGGHKSY